MFFVFLAAARLSLPEAMGLPTGPSSPGGMGPAGFGMPPHLPHPHPGMPHPMGMMGPPMGPPMGRELSAEAAEIRGASQ